MEHNDELRTAWDFVENTGHSIFLTGKAGTGKTTFLKTVVEQSRKRSVVVAPTGVAAINAGGVTIHSFFQLPFSPFVPNAQIKSKFDFGREKRKIIASLDLLIIDEISMVRSDLLDAIDSVLRRYRDRYKPFGGVQLLMIGDLQQLTPVVTPEDEQMLKPYYDTPYFFGSKALAQINYVTIQLEKVYRQQDDAFLGILNHIRVGKPTAEDLQLLNSRVEYRPAGDEQYIRLTTHNRIADSCNDDELRRLPGRQLLYKANITGTFPDYSYPTADTLALKVGAQVMFIKNDPTGDHRYYNGRIGKVTYADDSHVQVLCPGDDKAIDVEPLVWENTKYTLNPVSREIETDVIGKFTQLPLRLAWAITIHKSQGLTFDHAIIDAQQSFAPGQVYVALSRCRTLEGLRLASPIQPAAIINDQRVDNYISRQEEEAARSIEQLPTLKEEYYRHLMQELFDFKLLKYQTEYLLRLFEEFFMSSYPSLTQLLKQTVLDYHNRVTVVADKWLAVIAQQQPEMLHEETFLDRVTKSADYFAKQLTDLFAKPLRLALEVNTGNKLAMKRLGEQLADLQQTWQSRRLLLGNISEKGYTVSNYLRLKQMAMLDAMDEGDGEKKPRQRRSSTKELKPTKEPKPKKEPKPDTKAVTLDLFRNGVTPEAIAKMRGLTLDTIMNHLAYHVKGGTLRLDEVVSPEKQQTIRRVASKIGTADGITPIKNLCPPDVSYADIRLVLNSK